MGGKKLFRDVRPDVRDLIRVAPREKDVDKLRRAEPELDTDRTFPDLILAAVGSAPNVRDNKAVRDAIVLAYFYGMQHA